MTGAERLDHALKNGRFSHAYVFSGSEGTGTLARLAAKTLMCLNDGEKPCGVCRSCRAFESGNHPDVVSIGPDKKKSVSADHIRADVVADAYIRPYSAAYKAYIIDQADLMTPAAQNILLKTLEEPPPYGIFLLCAVNEDLLLPTVLSRCVRIRTSPLSVGESARLLGERRPGMPEGERRFYAALSGGGVQRAYELSEPAGDKTRALAIRDKVLNNLEDIENISAAEILLRAKAFEEYKDDARLLLDIMALWYRDLAVYEAGGEIFQTDIKEKILQNAAKGINNVFYVEEARARLSANTGFLLTIEVLMLKLGRKII